MGTRDELASLVDAARRDRRPAADRPRCCRWTEARDGLRRDGRGRRLRQDRLHPMTRTHLVTGAGSGIGAALADAAARARRRAGAAGPHRGAGRRAAPALRRRDRRWSPTWPTRRRLERRWHAACPTRSTRCCTSPASSTSARSPTCRSTQLREQLDVNLVAPAVLTRAALPGAARGARHRRVRELRRRAGRRARTGRRTPPRSSGCGRSPTRCAPRRPSTACGSPRSSPSRTATPMQEKVHEQEGQDYDPAALDPARDRRRRRSCTSSTCRRRDRSPR